MYTLEERMKAVELYIQSGCSEGTVIRTLGYPSHTALRNWYKEYLAAGQLRAGSAPKPRYTQEQKAAAVEYYAAHSTTLTQACRALGYPTRYVLRRWILETRPELLEKGRKPCPKDGHLVRYTQEQKQEAVEAMLVQGIPDYKVAARYGVSRAALYNWKQQLLGRDKVVPMKKKADPVEQSREKESLEAEIADLQQQIRRLQMERDALEKAAELLKKAGGINLIHLENPEKAEVIDALRPLYRLKELLQLFQISKSSYFYSVHAAQEDKYKELRCEIRGIFQENASCYGYRRIYTCLKKKGTTLSEKVVRRIMRQEKLEVYVSSHRKYSSYKGEISPEVPNILQRNFHAASPNQKWLTDLTEFALPAGKVYLSPVIDCFDGMVHSWTIGTSPNAQLVNNMLEKALATLRPGEHPNIHSDRGCHYRWPEWIKLVHDAGLTRSMSRKGCSPDNSACEVFFGRLKNEMYYGRSWAGVSLERFMEILDNYIHWYNEVRIKLSLDGMSPLEFRQSLGLIWNQSRILSAPPDAVVPNKSYQELAEHYATAIVPARVRAPKDKAAVEGTVGIISTFILAALRNQQFLSLPELNEAIWERLEAFNNKPFQKKNGSRASLFAEEKPFLRPLPPYPFELATWKKATVGPNYHISVERMNYSVPFEYIRQKVDVRLTRATVRYSTMGAGSVPIPGCTANSTSTAPFRSTCRLTTRNMCSGTGKGLSAGPVRLAAARNVLSMPFSAATRSSSRGINPAWVC